MGKRRFYQNGRNYSVNKNKRLQERTFYFTMYEKLWWSPAWQRLTPAAQNLFFAMVSEARFTFDKKNKKNPKNHTNNGKISFCEKQFKESGLGASQTYLRMYYLERSCKMQVMAQAGGNVVLCGEDVQKVVENQSSPKGMGILSEKLVWPAVLRRLDRNLPGYDT